MNADRQQTIWTGVIVGVIGSATVALCVSLGDALLGRSPFYTVSLLGEWMFYGLQDPQQVTVWPGAVLAYNGLHFVTFVAFGLLASWLATVSERGPLFWYAALVMYVFVLTHMFGAVQLLTEPLRAAIPLWMVWVPSATAAVTMSAYLMWMHPQLQREMQEWTDPTEHDEA